MRRKTTWRKPLTRGVKTLWPLLLTAVLVGAAGCGGGTRKLYALDVSPASVTLAPNQDQGFVSNSRAPADASSSYLDADSVSWEVVEGERGGTLRANAPAGFPKNSSISYTAPQTPGTYRLKATARYRDGATKTSTATVEVK